MRREIILGYLSGPPVITGLLQGETRRSESVAGVGGDKGSKRVE